MPDKQENTSPDQLLYEEGSEPQLGEDSFPYGTKGPSTNTINQLKEKYKDLEILPLAGKYWVYRQLKRTEHQKLLQDPAMDLDSDVVVVQSLLVWPDPNTIDWEDQPAGVVPTLSAEILRFSGFMRSAPPTKL